MSARPPSRSAAPSTQPFPERIIHANGVQLCVQSFGDPADPAVLLIAGLASSMLDWPEEFCQRLAAGSRHVIRYDHRDTGRSTTFPPGAPPYTGRDLHQDAIGVLDALGVAAAHLVGLSSGGGIAQVLAVGHPDRVASLTLVSTTSVAPGGPQLPPPSPEAMAALGAAPPDWTDRTAVIDYLAAQYRPLTARSRPVAEAALRELATRIVERAPTLTAVASMNNHWLLDSGETTSLEQLAGIAAPTLVMHGTEDPMFPFPHGVALAQAIPDAQLLTLEHTGHELPPATWDTVIPAILQHTTPSASSDRE